MNFIVYFSWIIKFIVIILLINRIFFSLGFDAWLTTLREEEEEEEEEFSYLLKNKRRNDIQDYQST